MVYFLVVLVVIVIAIALSAKPPGQKPPSLSEIDVPTAEEGKPIPVVFGTYVVQSPNIVWYGNLSYNKVKGSGK